MSELSKKVSNRLLYDIVSGTLPAGQHISARQVADSYGVSRTPVREAFDALEASAVLIRQPNRGYFVAETLPETVISDLGDTASLEASDYQTQADDWLANKIPEEVTEQFQRQRYDWTKAKISDAFVRAAREGWTEHKGGYG